MNDLIFDDIGLEKQMRDFLTPILTSDDIYNEFGEINIVPIDTEVYEDSSFPTIKLGVEQNGILDRTSDDMEIQNHSKFITTIEIYTSGENRNLSARKLANIIILNLQKEYTLYFNQNSQVPSGYDMITRRVLRAINIIDNVSGIIYK